jgi:hypothetical protein
MNIDLLEHIEIVNFLKSYSKIFKLNNQSNWIQVLCPYCDDSYRKTNISHGHFYIARNWNFSQCFRCEKRTSTKKFLLDIGFNNKLLLNQLFKSNIILSNDDKFDINNDKININNIHRKFQKYYPKQYYKFVNYIKYRLNDIDFDKFKIYPLAKNDKLTVGFNNYYDNFVTARFIDNNNIKYYKPQQSQNYFFNNPISYRHIIITEGIFDCINLYKYSTIFNDNYFYTAINGRNYVSNIFKLITNYYMIGNYEFNIIFDNDIKNIETTIKKIINKNNILNPMIKYNFYMPTKSKDISELNIISSISI